MERRFTRCETCGGVIGEQARPCADCGRGGTGATCPACKHHIAAGLTECWSCGYDLTRGRRPAPARKSSLREGEVAAVVHGRELPGAFRKTIDVELGTRAVRLGADGKTASLAPGRRHELKSSDRALLYRDGSFALRLRFPGLLTRDSIEGAGTARLHARVAEPMTLISNAMQGPHRERLTVGNLAHDLAWSLCEKVAGLVARASPDDADEEARLRDAVAALVTSSRAFPLHGLQVVEVVGFDFRSEAHARQADRRRELGELEREVEFQSSRAGLATKLTEGRLDERRKQMRAEHDFDLEAAELEHERNTQAQMRQHDEQELAQHHRDAGADAATKREHANELRQLKHDQQMARERTLGDAALQRDATEVRLERERLEFEARLRKQREERLHEVHVGRAEHDEKLERHRKGAELGLQILHDMKRRRQDRYERAQRFAREHEASRFELEERRKRLDAELAAGRRQQEAGDDEPEPAPAVAGWRCSKPECGAGNPDRARLCGSCGTPREGLPRS